MWSTTLFTLSVYLVPVLTQPSPPSQGVQLGSPTPDPPFTDIIFPLNVSQCEPLLIYYNLTYPYLLPILSPDHFDHVVDFSIPPGVGYLEWICDIPAGDGFLVFGNHGQYIVVQPGSSSSCLRSVTTTYSLVSYNTTGFQSYTQHPSNTASVSLGTYLASTVAYPTGAFSTITANPDLVAATSSVTASHKSKTPAIAGGIIGGVALILLAFGVVFCYMRRRRGSRLKSVIDEDQNGTSQPVEIPASESFQVTSFVPSTSNAEPPMGVHVPPPSHKAAGSSLRPATISTTARPDPIILSYNREMSQTRESSNLQSNSAAASDTASRLRPDASQPDVPTGFTASATSNSATENVPGPQTQSGSTSGGAGSPQNDRSNMVTAISAFTQLDPAERQTLVSLLHDVMASQSSPGLERQNTLRPPPPYDG